MIARSLDVIGQNGFRLDKARPSSISRKFFRQLSIYAILKGYNCRNALSVSFALHILYGEKYDDLRILIGWAVFVSLRIVMFPLETALTKLKNLAYNIWKLPAGVTGIILAVPLCPPFGASGAMVSDRRRYRLSWRVLVADPGCYSDARRPLSGSLSGR
ncbi:MAG: hypothetical protein R3D66_02290 [Alphaproteobacteria bacterium]